MEKAEREAIMRQGVVLPETPRDRRERAALEEDLLSIPLRGKPFPLRLRNFRQAADAYLAGARGPLAYMLRLRVVETRSRSMRNALPKRGAPSPRSAKTTKSASRSSGARSRAGGASTS
jgi:hypothetical protein